MPQSEVDLQEQLRVKNEAIENAINKLRNIHEKIIEMTHESNTDKILEPIVNKSEVLDIDYSTIKSGLNNLKQITNILNEETQKELSKHESNTDKILELIVHKSEVSDIDYSTIKSSLNNLKQTSNILNEETTYESPDKIILL